MHESIQQLKKFQQFSMQVGGGARDYKLVVLPMANRVCQHKRRQKFLLVQHSTLSAEHCNVYGYVLFDVLCVRDGNKQKKSYVSMTYCSSSTQPRCVVLKLGLCTDNSDDVVMWIVNLDKMEVELILAVDMKGYTCDLKRSISPFLELEFATMYESYVEDMNMVYGEWKQVSKTEHPDCDPHIILDPSTLQEELRLWTPMWVAEVELDNPKKRAASKPDVYAPPIDTPKKTKPKRGASANKGGPPSKKGPGSHSEEQEEQYEEDQVCMRQNTYPCHAADCFRLRT